MKTNREEILKNAFVLFMSANYEKASLSELGRMVGLTKAGMFTYYGSKQELFVAVVDKYLFNVQNPRNKFPEESHTLAEFIEMYVQGVQRTMDNLRSLRNELPNQNSATYHSDYYFFFLQILRYYPDPEEKLRKVAEDDYEHWRKAVRKAVNSGELKADTDVEEAATLFRQVFFGLSFEMSFLGGLDTQLLARHLRYVYSLLKS